MRAIDKSPVHGSAVAGFGRGVLILGPSGSGKSSLALHLLSLGADLVADDQVNLTKGDTSITMSAPASIANRIESRQFGLLSVPGGQATLSMVVDLARPSAARLPESQKINILSQEYPLINGKDVPNLAPSLWLCLKFGRPIVNTSL